MNSSFFWTTKGFHVILWSNWDVRSGDIRWCSYLIYSEKLNYLNTILQGKGLFANEIWNFEASEIVSNKRRTVCKARRWEQVLSLSPFRKAEGTTMFFFKIRKHLQSLEKAVGFRISRQLSLNWVCCILFPLLKLIQYLRIFSLK